MPWDSPLAALAEIVSACADVDRSGDSPGDRVVPLGEAALHVSRLVVGSPLELQTSTAADGTVTLAASPPRQVLQTSVMPVLHSIRLTVEVER